MKSLVSELEHFFLGHPGYVNLDQRFTHIVCLGGSLVALISIPINFFVVTGWFLTLTNIIEVIILISTYLYSRITGQYQRVVWPTLLSLLVFLSIQWFYNSGSTGGSQYYLAILALVGTTLLRSYHRFLYIGIIIVVLSGLIFAEASHPEWIVGYESQTARVIDIAFSMIVCLILVGVGVSALSDYNKELLVRIERKNNDLIKDLSLAKLLQEEVFQVKEKYSREDDFAMLYRPSSDVGGDFYDFTSLKGGLRILVADMKGHGINAALTAMLVKSEWSHSGHQDLEPGEALVALNNQLIQRYRGATVLCACILDIYPDSILFSSGGFPPQFVINGKEIISMDASGPMLGISGLYTYTTRSYSFNKESRFFLYSDALVEEFDQKGGIVGVDWLIELLKRRYSSSGQVMDSVIHKFNALTGKGPGSTTDDLTIIVSDHKILDTNNPIVRAG